MMTTTSTITAIVTTATTSVMRSPNQAANPQITGTNYPLSLLNNISLLLLLILLLSILLIDGLAHRRRRKLSRIQQEERELAEAWQEPWLTKDWSTLYGLIALAHSNAISPAHTPFQHSHIITIQTRSNHPQRWALRRLLEKGVIPLRINDGGVSTTCTQTRALTSSFPFITLPQYQQTKSRAYFEFLIPHPEEPCVTRLINILGQNRMGHGVSTRIHNSLFRKSKISTASNLQNRPKSGSGFPLSIGAESTCEVLLPFLPDNEIIQAQGTWVDWLDSYFKPGGMKEMEGTGRVPLLTLGSWAMVRVESGHWGYVELDNCVLGAVEDSGMKRRW